MQSYYPRISLSGRNYLLAIHPEYHTRLFPDAKLRNEPSTIIEDAIHANSNQKIYLSGISSVMGFNPGDNVLIYRTNANNTNIPAKYGSVVTSVCVVDEVKSIDSFNTVDDYFNYCGKNTVFTPQELLDFWESRKYPFIIKMTYHFSLSKRIIREELLKIISNQVDARWSKIPLTDEQLRAVLEASDDESFIIN